MLFIIFVLNLKTPATRLFWIKMGSEQKIAQMESSRQPSKPPLALLLKQTSVSTMKAHRGRWGSGHEFAWPSLPVRSMCGGREALWSPHWQVGPTGRPSRAQMSSNYTATCLVDRKDCREGAIVTTATFYSSRNSWISTELYSNARQRH